MGDDEVGLEAVDHLKGIADDVVRAIVFRWKKVNAQNLVPSGAKGLSGSPGILAGNDGSYSGSPSFSV
jgi:hypothetical protein